MRLSEAVSPPDWKADAMRVSHAMALATLCFGTLLSSCQAQQEPPPVKAAVTPVPATKAPPPTPLDVEKSRTGGFVWDPAWNEVVEKALPPEMLSHRVPRDVRRFCPCFYTMSETDQRAFWAYFFEALASAEAGLNPTTNVRHTEPEIAKVDPVTHEMIHSEGLLQLTYQDAVRYDCNFDWEADKHLPAHDPSRTILTPENNLTCGLKILANQLFVLHRPLFSTRSYWSTLQPGTISFRVFVKQMTDPPLACGLHTRIEALRVQHKVPLTTEEAAHR